MSKKNTAFKKRLFGRNLFTLIFILVAAVLLFFIIYVPTNYITTYNSNKIRPFIDKTKDTTFETQSQSNPFNATDAVYMQGKDFDDFGMIFKCTEYSEDSKSASYELRIYKTENTKSIVQDTVSVSLCLKANWIGFVAYSSTSPSTTKLSADKETAEKSDLSSTYKKTLKISSLADFPAKASTWPVKITVAEPSIYLYISYQYKENGVTKTNSYILSYSYAELIPETGGIRK